MFCRQCGTQNPDGAQRCMQCGTQIFYPPAGPAQMPPNYQSYTPYQVGTVPNYLVQSILLTIFCCLPFGIVAIVYASQVNGKLQMGDVQGAVAASNSARSWCWAAFLCGLIPTAIMMIFWVIGAAASMA